MSKKTLNICIAVFSAAIMLASAFGLYTTEQTRISLVSENQSYIYCAERTLELADAAGVADEKPVSHAADTNGMSKMEADLRWLADYNADLNRLDREYDELGTSPAVNGASNYAEACSAAVEYHQAQLDDANSHAGIMTAVCIAVFVLGLAGMAWSTLRISCSKEK